MKELCDYLNYWDISPVLYDRIQVVGFVGGSTTPFDVNLVDAPGKILELVQPMTEWHIRIAVEANNALLVTDGMNSSTYATSRLQCLERDPKSNHIVAVQTQNRKFKLLREPVREPVREPKQSFLSRLKTCFNWGAP